VRVLVVEDEAALADAVARGLRRDGMAVDVAYDGVDGHEKATVTRYDVIVLDRDLPGMSGDELCRQLAAEGALTRVLMLTASGTVADRVEGLSLGADDYMAKPFSLQELEARVRALTRRGLGTASAVIKHGPLTFDATGRVAYINDQMIELSARELSLLEVLLQRAGRLVSKDQLVERLCEWGEEVSNNAIEVYIHRLRKKIEQGPIRIATVRGLGYCLEKIPN
jgi:two-component system OmpR family response regulator